YHRIGQIAAFRSHQCLPQRHWTGPHPQLPSEVEIELLVICDEVSVAVLVPRAGDQRRALRSEGSCEVRHNCHAWNGIVIGNLVARVAAETEDDRVVEIN